MPQAVTHILIPILLVALFRDVYLRKRDKKHFPLHYVLFAGLGGVLPDIDIVISVLLGTDIHKTFTHTLFFPLILFAVFLVLKPINVNAKLCNLGRHNMKLATIFLVLAFGVVTHLALDTLFGTPSFLLYPFITKDFAINLFNYLPAMVSPALIDGILLVIWLVYLEVKHKISDFI